jgi:hypothetical protein
VNLAWVSNHGRVADLATTATQREGRGVRVSASTLSRKFYEGYSETPTMKGTEMPPSMLAEILEVLKKNPDTMYVSDTMMVAKTIDDKLIVITGDFRDITEDAANKILQRRLDRLIS